MANLNAFLEAEYEKMDRLLDKFPPVTKLHTLSEIELAGIATFIHNFYNGIENVLKRCLLSKNIQIPRSESWHKDLLEQAIVKGIISDQMKDKLLKYLFFRHFFVHAYALDLYAEKMEDLVEDINSTYNQFRMEIDRFLE